MRKTVSIVDFDGRNFAGVKEIPVPVWQKMARISGDMAGIEAELRGLMGMNESVWAEVTYTGKNPAGDIQSSLEEIVKGSMVEILSIRNESERKITEGIPRPQVKINDIKPTDMLSLYFDEYRIPEDMQKVYRPLYMEILREMELDYAE